MVSNSLLRYIKKKTISAFLHVFWIFPVRKNRITLLNELSFSFGDSLKYIFQYIKSKGLNYQIVFPTRSDAVSGAINVRPMGLKYFYYILTSRFIITNAGGVSYLPLRKSQRVINTWHGGGPYKKVGETVLKDKWSRKEIELNAKKTDYFLSSCEYFTKYELPAMRISVDKAVPTGLPRNDIFFSTIDSSIRLKVFNYIGVDPELKLVLYAPTFRGAFSDYAELVRENGLDLNTLMVKQCLGKRFGGEWVFAVRLHPKLNGIKLSGMGVLDVSMYPDMQELIAAADVVITDYSSLMWDVSLTDKPCFLYAKDIEDYEKNRGFYIPVARWPYPLAHSNAEMEQNILDFDPVSYFNDVSSHHMECGSYENGNACKEVMDLIESINKQ